MKLIPLNGHVVLKAEDTTVKSDYGIIIPDTADKEAPVQGTIHAVSENLDTELSAGDTVIFSKYGGTEVKINNETLIIIPESEILTKIINE